MVGRWCAAALAAVVVGMAVGRASAAITDMADLLARAPAGSQVIPLPAAQSVLIEDSRGVRDAPGIDPAGALSGAFECASHAFPCEGAYRITWVFPRPVVGLFGALTYFPGLTHDGVTNPGLDLFAEVPGALPNCGPPFGPYCGSWGHLFAAPTDTVSILWPAGLISTDDIATFRLSQAVAVVVPEPGALALLGTALLALATAARRRQRVRPSPAAGTG